MKIQICPVCEKEFKVGNTVKRKYCSRVCLSVDFKERLKGENNPNYRHGPTYCKHCNKKMSKNAKGNVCVKCIGQEKTGENNPFYGKKHTEETRRKMSENHYDCSGENNTFYGKKHTKETRKRISDARKEEWKSFSETEKLCRYSHLNAGIKKQLEQKGNTKPEKAIGQILKHLGISFKNNELLYDKFFVDFLLDNNFIIEVFGDYWHANPKIYNQLNEHQSKQIKKDRARLSYLNKCGRKVLVLWEYEIKNEIANVEQKIKNFLEKEHNEFETVS